MDVKEIQSSFQLIGTSIAELHILNSLAVYSENMDGKKNLDVSYQVREIVEEPENGRRLGILDLSIKLNAFVEEKPFSIEMTMEGAFTIAAETEKETFKKMMEINGCAAMYSIARAAISSISAQMFACGNIILPMVNFVRFHEVRQPSND